MPPVYCGMHDYAGFEPCPDCANLGRSQTAIPVVLNGERVVLGVDADRKPKWLPGFLWRWMSQLVLARGRLRAGKRPVDMDYKHSRDCKNGLCQFIWWLFGRG